MKENAISKINKVGRIGNIITNIAKVVVTLGMIAVLISAILFAALPKDTVNIKVNGGAKVAIDLSDFNVKLSEQDKKDFVKQIEDKNNTLEIDKTQYKVEAVDVTDNGYTINAEGEIVDFSLSDVAWVMVAALVNLAMTLVTLFFIGSLCKAFRNCKSPFEADVIKKMKRLAYSLIPWVILSTITDGIVQGMFTHSIKINANFSLGTVMVILIILGLSYIFQYGAVLQQESDETL